MKLLVVGEQHSDNFLVAMDPHNSGFSVESQDTQYFQLGLGSQQDSEDIIFSTESLVCQSEACQKIEKRSIELTPFYDRIVVQTNRQNTAAEQWYLDYMNTASPSQCYKLECMAKRSQCYKMLGAFVVMRRIARLTEYPRVPVPRSLRQFSELNHRNGESYKHWVEPSPKGEYFARCRYCKICLPLRSSVLKSHHRNLQHQLYVVAVMQRFKKDSITSITVKKW